MTREATVWAQLSTIGLCQQADGEFMVKPLMRITHVGVAREPMATLPLFRSTS
jgi:hypothetical protein